MSVTASPDATSSRKREHVARHEGDVRLESGRQAGAVDQAVARRRRPGVAREPLEVDPPSPRKAVPRRQRRHHRLLEESWRSRSSWSRRGAAASWNRTASWSVPSRTAATSSSTGPSETLTSRSGSTALSARGHPARSSRWRSGTPLWPAVGAARPPERRAAGGQAQPARDGIRVPQKERAGGGETQPAGAAVDQRIPSCRSSERICCEDGGRVSDNSSAARENEPSRATSRKVSRRRGSSISSFYRCV